VPGPPMPLYMHGAELVAFYPHGPIFEGVGLNLTVLSYQGSVDIGVIGCRDSVHDADQLAAGFVNAVERLRAAAELEAAPDKRRPAGRPTPSPTA
ncbi:MAG: putative diacylglycerol O-acyltransferase, partial [Mycobacterium sp.]|nr:putative diacylglycerol O-acyltransferase [Mycobacterium sp.]